MRPGLDLGGLARGVFFALTPAVAVGGALGFPVLMLVTAAFSLRPRLVLAAMEKRPVFISLLLAFTAWVAVSAAWSPSDAWPQAGKVAVLAATGLIFAAAAAERPALTLAGGLAAVLVLIPLLAIEAIWTMPLNRAVQPDVELGDLGRNLSRGATFLLAIAWAAIGGLLALGQTWRVGLAALLVLACAALSLQFDQQANAAAFLLALAAFGAAFAAPRLALLAVSGGLALWMLAAPFAIPLLLSNPHLLDGAPMSWAARGGIWTYVSARVSEQAWIGHGLEASRAVTDRVQVRDIDVLAVPVHPHSASLQIWFETGAVGALLAAATILVGGLWLAKRYATSRAAAASIAATIAFIGVIANVSFGLWAEWWIATMFIAAGLLGALPRRASAGDTGAR